MFESGNYRIRGSKLLHADTNVIHPSKVILYEIIIETIDEKSGE